MLQRDSLFRSPQFAGTCDFWGQNYDCARLREIRLLPDDASPLLQMYRRCWILPELRVGSFHYCCRPLELACLAARAPCSGRIVSSNINRHLNVS